MINEDEVYKHIGQNICHARVAAGYKQDYLARQVGLNRTSITNIEKGKQKILIHTLYLIADALSVPIDQLLPSQKSLLANVDSILEGAEITDILGKQNLLPDDKDAILKIIKPK